MQIVYVHNCLLSRSTKVIDASMTPFEMRTGRRPSTSTLRVMYSKIVAVYRSSYDKARQSKIDPPTVTGIYLGIDRRRGGGGIDDMVKSCFVYLPEQQRFTTLNFHDCTFFEDEFPTIGTAIAVHRIVEDLVPIRAETGTDAAGRRGRGSGRGRGRSRGRGRGGESPAPVIIADADAHYVALNRADQSYVPLASTADGRILSLNLLAGGGLPEPPKKLSECASRGDGDLWMLSQYGLVRTFGRHLLGVPLDDLAVPGVHLSKESGRILREELAVSVSMPLDDVSAPVVVLWQMLGVVGKELVEASLDFLSSVSCDEVQSEVASVFIEESGPTQEVVRSRKR